jgi:nickel transport protein
MEKELGPVLKMLAELRGQGPSVSDILGGIGYIFGLMGVGAYFNYRHKLAEVETKNEG